ncbi:MAG: type I secretion protein [Rhodobacteraceae bacterium]|nr:type I secretion protein [Paracoccaceae bacterium]
MGALAFLFLAAFGVATFAILDDDDEQSDAEDTPTEPQVITGTDGSDVLSGIGADAEETDPVRIIGGAGDDVLAGDDGDSLSGGEGNDFFEIVVGDRGADPVIIEDLDFALTDLDDQPDRVLFIQPDGQVVPYRGVLEAGLIAQENDDGTGADLIYDGQVVATVLGGDADELNAESLWVANFSPGVVSRLDGDDIFIGDVYQNKDDFFEGGDGDDVLIGGNGSDYLAGGAGDDRINARDPDGSTEDFDLVSGGLGDDYLVVDQGDIVSDTYLTDDDQGYGFDADGADTYEVVLSDDPDAAPVVILDDYTNGRPEVGDRLFFSMSDGTPVTDAELAENLETVEVEDYGGVGYLYDGVLVAVVFDAPQIFAAAEEEFSDGSLSAPAGDVIELAAGAAARATGLEVSLPQYGVTSALSYDITLTDAVSTGNVVSDALFGVNAVYKVNTDSGDPLETYRESVDILDSEIIRFPAGQGDGLNAEDDGVEWLNVVKMVNDGGEWDLRPELKSFLDWAQDPDGDGDHSDAKKVTLVIPTKFLSTEEYEDFKPEIRRFTAKVMEDYGDVVDTFEIGNEYWEMGETAYATKANIAIQGLLKGFSDAGLDTGDEPKIIVQMATPNSGSEFHYSVDDRGYETRVKAANQQIIDTLSDTSKDAIDGVIEHYYYTEKDDVFGDTNAEVNNINTDYAVWDAAFEKDLDLYLTEWNIKTSNIYQSGLRYTGAFSEQLEYAVRLGTDQAYIWAVQHNTITDLAGSAEDPPLVDDEGRLVSTIRGATYDLMRDTLPGMENLELDYSGSDGEIEINGYYSDDKVVFYVASRVPHLSRIDLDLSAIVPDFESAEAVRISIDLSDNSSDGVHFQQGQGKVEAEYDVIDGERFYYGEHDLRAKLTDYELTTNTPSFSLKPYEMAQITFHLGDGDTGVGEPNDDREIFGTSQDDDLAGGQGNDTIQGAGGNDKLTGDLGDDALYGDDGDDRIYGWGGDDVLEGGEGNDKLSGNQGDDLMKGQKGSDILIGADGDDVMNGGTGHDTIRGGAGADQATGWTGMDTFAYTTDEIQTGDTIEDFTLGEDVIQLEFDDVSSVDDLTFKFDREADGVYITVAGHGTIYVKGVFTYRQISAAANFVFV